MSEEQFAWIKEAFADMNKKFADMNKKIDAKIAFLDSKIEANAKLAEVRHNKIMGILKPPSSC